MSLRERKKGRRFLDYEASNSQMQAGNPDRILVQL